MIMSKSLKQVCLNDAMIENFEAAKTVINTTLQTIVPEVCEFEREYIPKDPEERQNNEF